MLGSIVEWMFPATGILIAIAVAFTGRQQYKLSRDQHRLEREKFKLDLFEKRFGVYKAVQRFISIILRDRAVDLDNNLFEFRRDTQDAIFLFSKDIVEYVDRVDNLALELWEKIASCEGLPVGEELSRLCREQTDLIGALRKELHKLKDVFAPYLKFDKWK